MLVYQVSIALDIARGMNYLHHATPRIIHRNLNSLCIMVSLPTLRLGKELTTPIAPARACMRVTRWAKGSSMV